MPIRNPTIKDVAARAGVSKSSVSRVLQGSSLVSEASREAVLRAMDELGYRPNAAARTLVSSRSNTIGVLLTDLRNPFLIEIVEGIEPVAEQHGYTVLVVSGKRQSRAEASALHKLLELRVDGIVCDTTRLDRQALLDAARATPIATLTRTPEVPRVDSVVTDDPAGAALVVDHLTGLGHRHIALVADTQERAGLDRIRGYEEAMRAHGLGEEIRIVPADFTQAGGRAGGERLFAEDRPVTAVFAANDFSALGVLEAAAAAGLDVPGDVSVVGYDDISLAAQARVSLTTVHQPAQRIGEAAVKAVLARIEQPERPARRIVMEPRLVARGTTGPAAAPAARAA
jgi:DNA-binding LacI/PurR family transcriptional regulator